MTNNNEVLTPSVNTTFLPSTAGINNFYIRAQLRSNKGRIYNWPKDIDAYAPADGSVSFDGVSFPLDLGPDVLTATSLLYDLRNDDGTAGVIDLNPLS